MSAPDIATLIQDAVSRAVTGALVQRTPPAQDSGHGLVDTRFLRPATVAHDR